MANSLYNNARVAFANAEINWTSDNIKAVLLSPSYAGGSVSIAGDSNFTSIAPYVLTGTIPSVTLTSKVTSVGTSPNIITGALSAAPVTFVSVTAGQIIGYIAIYKDINPANINGVPLSGDQSTSLLISLFDSGFGIGAGTNGANIQITWDQVNGILRL